MGTDNLWQAQLSVKPTALFLKFISSFFEDDSINKKKKKKFERWLTVTV